MPNDFTTCSIAGVLVRSLQRFDDRRGWLTELFREDELPQGYRPAMGYISLTRPGVSRGPHEHRDQTDGFAFTSGLFEITLWENRPGRERTKWILRAGEEAPVFLLVPPGVVHAYRNAGDTDAVVFNFPNRLYAGTGRAEPVDEIRHEDQDSEFRL
jgi:dTDP-4-dehydrorhamnose 3,5-epimerase